MPDSLRTWIEKREPAIPGRFLPHLTPAGGEVVPSPEGLADAGVDAILRALERPGRVRESAFHLLVGDALLTYACEALAGAPDLESRLRELLRDAGSRLTG